MVIYKLTLYIIRLFTRSMLTFPRQYPAIPIASVAHIIVALFYRYYVGMSITIHPVVNNWDIFFQTAPLDLLQKSPIQTILYFHAQPPLYNILGAILGRLFYPAHLEALYTLYIIFGALMVLMSGVILLQLIPKSGLRNIILAFIAFYPSLFVYETYILYTQMTAFLVVVCVFWVAFYQKTQQIIYLYLFIFSLNLVVLTRSFFHPVIIVVAVIVLPLWVTHQRRRVVIVSSFISLLTIVVFVKNLVLFSFWGLSSWSGMNLYQNVMRGYEQSELQALVADGIIDPMVVEVAPFKTASEYEAYGFTKTSEIPVLNNNDRNNINYIEIATQYGDNAMTLIKHDPLTYLKTIKRAYFIYSLPSNRFFHVIDNADKMGLHGQIYNPFLSIKPKSVMFLVHGAIIPIIMVLYILYIVRQAHFSWRGYIAYLRQDKVLLTIFGFVIYGLVVGTTMEFGENYRFKYLTEIPLILLTGKMIYQPFAPSTGPS